MVCVRAASKDSVDGASDDDGVVEDMPMEVWSFSRKSVVFVQSGNARDA